jgi:DNA (cytosine-5)-methyltransferase 1
MALHTIECFSGVGMLGEGLRSGLQYLGIKTRTICHIEREAYPASVLAARGQDQCLDDAPVWSDITTFDARAWHGAVDIVVGGFPCQDLSLAGRRDGLDGKRSGLFFELVRIARDSGARYMFLENVLGIHSATATVMDEAEGELEERAAARVVGELADLGWNAEWVTLSASEVGASHGRARWFCWAWRMEVLGHPGHEAHNGDCNEGDSLGDTPSTGQQERRPSGERKLPAQDGLGLHDRPKQSGGELDYAQRECKQRQRIAGELACAGSQNQAGDGRKQWLTSDGSGNSVDNPSSPRPQGPELGTTCTHNRGGQETHGSTSQLCSPHGLFAPGPSDPRWGHIIERSPWYTPALSTESEHDAKAAFSAAEPLLCREPDGLATGLDFAHRTQRLKACGNGVVALQAAIGLITAIRRAGI